MEPGQGQRWSRISAQGVDFMKSNRSMLRPDMFFTFGRMMACMVTSPGRAMARLAGTVLVKDIWPGASSQSTTNHAFVYADGLVFFAANDGLHGRELWVSDVTFDTTVMVYDTLPGPTTGSADYLTLAGDWLFYSASDDLAGPALWAVQIAPATPKRYIYLPLIIR